MSVAQPIAQIKTDDIDYMELDRIIEEDFGNDKENLIMILQAIQKKYNYLPKPALAYLATKISVPMSKIYGVATFYSTFSLEPRGKHIVSVCTGTACHVRGAPETLAGLALPHFFGNAAWEQESSGTTRKA